MRERRDYFFGLLMWAPVLALPAIERLVGVPGHLRMAIIVACTLLGSLLLLAILLVTVLDYWWAGDPSIRTELAKLSSNERELFPREVASIMTRIPVAERELVARTRRRGVLSHMVLLLGTCWFFWPLVAYLVAH